MVTMSIEWIEWSGRNVEIALLSMMKHDELVCQIGTYEVKLVLVRSRDLEQSSELLNGSLSCHRPGHGYHRSNDDNLDSSNMLNRRATIYLVIGVVTIPGR
jgi:hypothetical protein